MQTYLTPCIYNARSKSHGVLSASASLQRAQRIGDMHRANDRAAIAPRRGVVEILGFLHLMEEGDGRSASARKLVLNGCGAVADESGCLQIMDRFGHRNKVPSQRVDQA